MINKLKAYAWQALAAILFVALVATGFKLWTEQLAHADTRADRDRISLSYAKYVGDQLAANKNAADEARAREQQLQTAADKFRKDAYVQINRLRVERDDALASLRDRPDRPASGADGAGVPAAAGPGAEAKGCTGAQLYRSDAEFLVGLAADHDELRIEFNKLWDLYQRARSQADENAVTDVQ